MAQCTTAFGRAWTHMVRLLFQPFRLIYWLKMTLLLLLSSGITAPQTNYRGGPFQSTPGNFGNFEDQFMQMLPWIIVGGVILILLAILFGFFYAAAKILFYDSVYKGKSYYLKSFSNHLGRIVSLFLWNIIVGFIITFAVALLFGVLALVVVLGLGGVDNLTSGVGIVLIILGIGLTLIVLILVWIYYEMLESLVVPHMVVKEQGIFAGWGFAIGRVLENLFEFAGYMVLRLLIALLFMAFLFVANLILAALAYAFMSAFGQDLYYLAFGLFFFISLPFMYMVLFFLLPFSVFLHAYALSFVAEITHDPEYEPQSDALQPAAPASQPTKPAAPDADQPATPEGPVNFSEISPSGQSPPNHQAEPPSDDQGPEEPERY